MVDIARAWGEVVEIQTRGFGRLRPKLERLLGKHPVLVVHPVAVERRVLRVDAHGEVVSARRSPKRDGPLAVLTVDSPPLNLWDATSGPAFIEALNSLDTDPPLRGREKEQRLPLTCVRSCRESAGPFAETLCDGGTGWPPRSSMS